MVVFLCSHQLTEEDKRTSVVLQDKHVRWTGSDAGKAVLESRARLPICAIRKPLLLALQQSDVVVVSGDTGACLPVC